MKLCNFRTVNGIHLGLVRENGIADLTAAGFALDMESVIRGEGSNALKKLENESLPLISGEIQYANLVSEGKKLVCVGLNYYAHAMGLNEAPQSEPVIFCKMPNSLTYAGATVPLAPWEDSYDYEAELVCVIGKTAWGVSEEEAKKCIFGFTCGNDLSCRVPQKRSGQWLIGKAMPGFGPVGPNLVTADTFNCRGRRIQSYVNGELRQDGNTDSMMFSCEKIVSYVSHYIRLAPGDLVFTGTPSGVALEKSADVRKWLAPGDRVDIVIEGIGTLTNYLG